MHPPRACCGKLCEEPNPADIGLCRTLQRLSGVGGSPNNLVNVISYVTLGYSQKACRTSIRNNTGNWKSRLLTSAPPHGWCTGYCPDWQERPGRRCGECSKNTPGLYDTHYQETLAFPGPSTLESHILPNTSHGGGKPQMRIPLLSEGGFRRDR